MPRGLTSAPRCPQARQEGGCTKRVTVLDEEDGQLEEEYERIHLMQAVSPWAESRFARYLDIDPLPEVDEPGQGNSTNDRPSEPEEYKSIPEARQRARARMWENWEALLEEARRADKRDPPAHRAVAIPAAEVRRQRDRRAADQWTRHRRDAHLQSILRLNADTRDGEGQLRALLKSELRVRELRAKLDDLRAMVVDAEEETKSGDRAADDGKPSAGIHALGDVTFSDFKIDRGTNASMRATDPFNEARINEIVGKVQIGTDLTDDQKRKVVDLVREYADIFALSMSEVFFVDWWKHHIDVDPNAKLPTRISQRPLTEKQKEWFYNILDEMEASHVIQRVPGEFLKCLNSTNLAPKEAGKTGITRAEVLRKVNSECVKNGLPPFWEEVREPGDPSEALLDAVEEPPGKPAVATKWRVCHAFTALNKASQIPPFPHGDLNLKHQFAAGHRWASVIDFAAGYYAVPLDDETVPYTAFYVEGRGYFVYLRMPFGLTGAPTTFCEMVATALEDMIGRELVNWMDDICLPGDVFETKLANLRKFFQRCRDKGLSLSPSRTKLFFTDVLFAGAMVGPNGLKPNLDKIGAVVNWPVPESVAELMGFLGLTNYFRRMIPD
ncbi:Retrovirus-related Pol polyprotein from transposon 17,6 [Mycena venus]|uniref:Retrovirus-related Pol polyprotein from transposon 17,6 n=1 Tax=Mycena venus TaxID=2733690 RepID=A0A8H6Z4V5_9AGAR|nr:Retrovirus-related Pol polyprotein from transposon 17,6 [Mycena venus]